jgi:hypothetical protein
MPVQRYTGAWATFFLPGPGESVYTFHRDHESRADVRARLAALWGRYQEYCGDSHFRSDAVQHFNARVWEMYLAVALLDHGFTLARPPKDGPDIKIVQHVPRPCVWIEATTAEPGEGDNRAERIITSRSGRNSYGYVLDHDKIVLRLSNAIAKKAQQYQEYQSRGHIGEGDAYVIALNAGQIQDADMSPGAPHIVQAVFPIGGLQFLIEPYSDKRPEVRHAHRPAIQLTKRDASGQPKEVMVSTSTFLTKQYRHVSAVMFSPYGIWNASEESGRDIITVHNPEADVPLPPGFFRFGREYRLADEAVRLTDWRTPRSR